MFVGHLMSELILNVQLIVLLTKNGMVLNVHASIISLESMEFAKLVKLVKSLIQLLKPVKMFVV